MPTPHIHAEFIKAWADGKKIERLVTDSNKQLWVPCIYPTWQDKEVYRVAKTNVTKYRVLTAGKDGVVRVSENYYTEQQAKASIPGYLTIIEATAKVFEE